MTGFYVPGSRTGSYVASKRDEEGSFRYDKAAQEIGIQKQAALQDLSESYASTIENAYASYLSGQRAIQGSLMGQGYKEAYLEQQQQNLVSNIAEANKSVAQARAELGQQESEARAAIQKQYETEVTNLDKIATSMEDYLSYVKTLTPQEGEGTAQTILGIDTERQIDDLYEALYGAQPRSMIDPETGKAALSYREWVKANTRTSADTDWANWVFYQGGWEDFLTAAQKAKFTPEAAERRQAYETTQQLKQQEEAKAEKQKNIPYYIDSRNITTESEYNAFVANNPTVANRTPTTMLGRSNMTVTAEKIESDLQSGKLKYGDIIKFGTQQMIILRPDKDIKSYDTLYGQKSFILKNYNE